jgi:glycosyltransferase involved in cell wall biosynthesis
MREHSMRVALVADAFPPMRTSAAVQMRDLAREMVRQGHRPVVLIPTPDLAAPWKLEQMDGVEVLRLRCARTKDVGYIRRALAEAFMPFAMLNGLARSPLASERWDGVVWYSPSIFLSPVASKLKKASKCLGYLIVRDVFPEWAVDMGMMRRGLAYRFFKLVERYQYSVADVIGIQTPANGSYFSGWANQPTRRVEVLQNWLADAKVRPCSIDVKATRIGGRRVFVYAGNMGLAQGMDIVVRLADLLRHRDDIGFLFVGRGSEVPRLRAEVERLGLDNVVFHDEIDPDEIPGLYSQCDVGIVALDPRHKTHNIPGKFLTYMQAGLPVLAKVNAGNDLETLIRKHRVGEVSTGQSAQELAELAGRLIASVEADVDMPARCQALWREVFSADAAVTQIAKALALQPSEAQYKAGVRADSIGATLQALEDEYSEVLSNQ